MQLQRAINDTRRWISILSSETIGHLKKYNKCICFINTNARLFCDARPRLDVTCNDIEKVTLDVGSFSPSPQVQNCPTSLFYLLNSLSCNSLFCKLRLTSYLHIKLVNTRNFCLRQAQAGEHLCVCNCQDILIWKWTNPLSKNCEI